ncbi:MAG: DUF2341 domain-containing protein [Verrucomicrobiota bacterium]
MKIQHCGYVRFTPLTNIPQLVVLNETRPGFRYADFASTAGHDLRFFDESQTVELNYEIENWDPAGDSHIWVQVPQLDDVNTCIYAYWGNAIATNIPTYTTNGATWSEGYVGVWHFNGSGHDSAIGQDGTIFGNSLFVNGINAGALDFDGVGDYVDVGDGFADFDGGITVEAWSRMAQFRNWTRIVDLGNGAAVDTVYLANQGGGPNLRWEFHDTLEPGTEQHDIDAPTFVLNTWQHIVATVDGGAPNTSTSRIYIDGFQQSQANNFTVPANVFRTRNYIGESNSGGDDFYTGTMDEVRISNRDRSADWIWAVWANQFSNSTYNCFSPAGLIGGAPHIVHAGSASNLSTTTADISANRLEGTRPRVLNDDISCNT